MIIAEWHSLVPIERRMVHTVMMWETAYCPQSNDKWRVSSTCRPQAMLWQLVALADSTGRQSILPAVPCMSGAYQSRGIGTQPEYAASSGLEDSKRCRMGVRKQ